MFLCLSEPKLTLLCRLPWLWYFAVFFHSLSHKAIVYILKDIINHFLNHKTFVNISYFVL